MCRDSNGPPQRRGIYGQELSWHHDCHRKTFSSGTKPIRLDESPPTSTRSTVNPETPTPPTETLPTPSLTGCPDLHHYQRPSANPVDLVPPQTLLCPLSTSQTSLLRLRARRQHETIETSETPTAYVGSYMRWKKAKTTPTGELTMYYHRSNK